MRAPDQTIANARRLRRDMSLPEVQLWDCLRGQKLEAEVVTLRQQLDSRAGIEDIVGSSPAMNEVLELVQQVAPTRATALITYGATTAWAASPARSVP